MKIEDLRLKIFDCRRLHEDTIAIARSRGGTSREGLMNSYGDGISVKIFSIFNRHRHPELVSGSVTTKNEYKIPIAIRSRGFLRIDKTIVPYKVIRAEVVWSAFFVTKVIR